MRESLPDQFYKKLVLAFFLFTTIIRVQATSLSGSYTIDSSLAASATNFKTFNSAITYLTGSGVRNDGGPSNSFPFGVTGPVEFIVAPGTYTEQVTMATAITGISAANTVTFTGTDQATCILSHSAVAASNHTLRLTGMKYVTFRDLTIRTTGSTHGWGVHISGAGTLGVKIKRCFINITGNGAISTNINYGGIVVSVNTTSQVLGLKADSLEIDSNTIQGGYYGIVTTGLSNNTQLRNRIRGNQVYNSYFYGIFANYQDGIEISGNTVIPRAANAVNNGIGINNSSAGTGTYKGAVINGNRVTHFGTYGIYVNASNNDLGASTKGLIINNMVGGGAKNAVSNAIYMSGSKNWSIAHNTILHDVAVTAAISSALYINTGANIAVLNNIIAVSKGGAGLPLYCVTSGVIDSMDYNMYYHSDTSSGNFIYHSGTFYNTGSFIGAGGFDQHSIFRKPLFVNDTNLHVFNSCNKGMQLPYVTYDIDRNSRSSQPVIGAHEPPDFPLNLTLLAITSPGSNITPGLQDMSVQVKNSGTSLVSGFDLSYRLNNGTQVTQSWSGSLLPCDTTSITFSGSNQVNLSTVNYIKVYVTAVNAMTDANPADDTLNHKLFAPLTGNYTVGNSGDFRSLKDVVTALQAQGVVGAVSFGVLPGTYPGQFVLNGPISGSSPQNTITFDGTDADSVTLTSSTASGATVIANQCSYTNFRNLTVTNTYVGNCAAFSISGNNMLINTNVSVKNCVLNVPGTNAQSSTYGLLVTGAAAGYGLSDNRVDSVEIDSNVITGANTGIAVAGNGAAANILLNAYNRNYKFRNNTVTTTNYQSDAGISITNLVNGIDLFDNRITSPNGTGISLYKVLNNITGNQANHVVGNKIRAGYAGLNFQLITSDTNNPMVVANNEIILRSSLVSTGINYINITGIQGDRIYNNTVYIDSNSTTLSGYGLYYAGDTTSEIRNNIFVYAGKGSAVIYPVYIEKGVRAGNLDNNLYFNATMDSLVKRNGVPYNSSNFRTAEAGGSASFFEVPSLISNTDLHLNSGCPRGVDVSTYVPLDLEKQPRANPPSIGCYEFAGYTSDLAIVKLLQPVAPFATGLQNLRVRIANKGNNSISSFQISYVLNNGSAVTQNWAGTLAPCDTMTLLFTGANQMNVMHGHNTLKVYVGNPNGGTDGHANNDTLGIDFSTPLTGTYVIGAAPSDYLTFTAAVNDLTARGVSGPVVFNVKTGTYNESFTLSAVSGSSVINNVTFQSLAGHRDSVSINNSGPNTAVITYTSASHITLRNLSINQQLDADYQNSIFMGGDCSYDTIENCNITIPAFTSAFTMALYTVSLTGNGLVVKGCTISGGYANMMVNAVDAFLMASTEHKNAVFVNNNFVNGDSYSASFYKSTNLVFANNTITTNSTAAYGNGITLQSCDSAVRCVSNTLTGYAGGRGIYFYGGQSHASARPLIANNIVSMGSGINATYGIQVEEASYLQVYHNSVHITSTAAASTASHFMLCQNIDVKNNVFTNSGGGYAVHSTVPLSIRSNYNNLYTTGTNLAKQGTTNYTTLASWKASAYQDTNSVSYRPGFTSNTNLKPDVNDSACWSLNGHGVHLDSNVLRTDLENNGRPLTRTAGVPDIGAYEFTPVVLPPLATAVSGTITPGDSQVFVFAGDTVAKIYWHPFSTVPYGVRVRQYSGEKPPGVTMNEKFMYFYLDVQDSGNGIYAYNADVYYKDQWMGTTPAETDLRLVQKQNPGWALVPASQVDNSRNMLSGQFLSTYSWLTGTDQYNPLPVALLDLDAQRAKDNVVLNWTTASEQNSQYFEIERNDVHSASGWKKVGQVKAAGNSNRKSTYTFTDEHVAALKANTLLYRLRIADKDGAASYSKTVSVRWNQQQNGDLFAVYPNPFSSELHLVTSASVTGSMQVTISDVTGQTRIRQEFDGASGLSQYVLPVEGLSPGIYFVTLQSGDNVQVLKLVKNNE